MTTTEDLLKYSTRGAITRMVNEENGLLFDGGEAGPLVISEPLNLGGIRTEVELTIRRKVHKNDVLPYPGRLVFRLNRLDLNGTIGGYLEGFRPQLPTSARTLLDEITARTGITFEDEDFILEDIIRTNAAPYVLKAKPTSLRWVGQTEIKLIDLTDLDAYLTGGLPAQTPRLNQTPQLVTMPSVSPYINGMSVFSEIDPLPLQEEINEVNDPLFKALAKVIPAPGRYLADAVAPWVISNTASPFNLKGARLAAKYQPGTPNPINPALDRVFRVRLSNLDTTYGEKLIEIPYSSAPPTDLEFIDKPRMSVSAVVNASDGTPWNVWLNSLLSPSLITSLPNGMNLLISGPQAWTAIANQPGPTSLYNAVVQYNGQRRTTDMRPYNLSCNRVIQLSLSDHNTAYRGNITFHYRAPIILIDALPSGNIGETYDVFLNPTEGQAPYTTRVVGGNLAPGHNLTPDNRLVGSNTTPGAYTVTLEVKDARGVAVNYTYSYRLVVAPMSLQGTPPDAVLNQPYSFQFTASGGVPPYSFAVVNGPAAGGLTFPNPTVPVLSGTPTNAGVNTFDVRMIDNRGMSIVNSYTLKVA